MILRTVPAFVLASLLFIAPAAPAALQQRAGAPAVEVQATLSDEQLSRIRDAIGTFMSEHRVPGVSVALVVDGRLQWEDGFGFTDLENFVPTRPESVFRLASISKSLTAVAVMQLAEAGKLDLDAPIQTYVPEFPEKQYKVTARDLLRHMAGIRHYRADEIGNTRHYRDMVEALEIFKDDPLLFEPGTRYGYTTYGYTLLGLAVERASGQDFMSYLREHIFEPAGMHRTRDDDLGALIANRARGYDFEEGRLVNAGLFDPSYKVPGGGLVAPAGDLARLAIALQEGRLLGEKSWTQMTTLQNAADTSQRRYGYGWVLGGAGMHPKSVWHTGGQQGATTILYTIPSERFAVAILTNRRGVGPIRQLAAEIGRIVLENAADEASPTTRAVPVGG